jgi:hypothetical protein
VGKKSYEKPITNKILASVVILSEVIVYGENFEK